MRKNDVCGSGYAGFMGIKDGKPVYMVGVNINDSEEEQKDTLCHELAHVYYRSRKERRYPYYARRISRDEAEQHIRKEASRMMENSEFVNWLFDYYRNKQEEIITFLKKNTNGFVVTKSNQ